MSRLEGAVCGYSQILRLLAGKRFQLHTQFAEVQHSNLLVKFLGQHIHAHRIFRRIRVEFDLSHHLVGEAVGHHEARVPGGATQIHQPALGQHDDTRGIGTGNLNENRPSVTP